MIYRDDPPCAPSVLSPSFSRVSNEMPNTEGTIRFIDGAGDEWMVHEVVRQVDSGARNAYLPPEWQRGWLLFEHGDDKRRLAPVPPSWRAMPVVELIALLEQATRARPPRGPLPPRAADAIVTGRPRIRPARPDPQHRVLVIDSDAPSRQQVQRALAPLNVEVLEASDGAAGLALARNAHPHVIILDYWLPGMSGGTVLDRLRGNGATVEIPVLWFSLNERVLDLDPRAKRASGRVPKAQFDADQFRRRIAELLGIQIIAE